MFGQDYASFGLQTGSKQFRIEIGPIERASRASTGMEQMDKVVKDTMSDARGRELSQFVALNLV
jgi:hypothetical protein